MQKIELSVGQAFSLHAAVMAELDRAEKKLARIQAKPRTYRIRDDRERAYAEAHVERLRAMIQPLCAACREESPA